MKHEFDLATYVGRIKKSSSYFYTFINRDSLAAGILLLNPGEKDTQEPHDNDEIYYIISGDGFLKIKDKNYPVLEDKVFFVEKMSSIIFMEIKKSQSFIFFWWL